MTEVKPLKITETVLRDGPQFENYRNRIAGRSAVFGCHPDAGAGYDSGSGKTGQRWLSCY